MTKVHKLIAGSLLVGSLAGGLGLGAGRAAADPPPPPPMPPEHGAGAATSASPRVGGTFMQCRTVRPPATASPTAAA
ncbi:hypothetical protein K7Z46_10955, partial [Mycobacterium avium subsp. hominissuis]|nr:hypothetical protein [Mycobacterium avium subsp. hominissuis]